MWDYLIITASNDLQAKSYTALLEIRRERNELPQVRDCFVVADLQNKRIGSGGSTLQCLVEVLNRHVAAHPELRSLAVSEILRGLRVLIVHAGGDSRRLPAYGPCGKIFVPIPGEAESSVPATLFDRLVPDFLAYPAGAAGHGQIVVAAGDALILLDGTNLNFSQAGITAVGCPATPEEASRHGVFCVDPETGMIRRFLQKPSIDEQNRLGAIDRSGRATLDVGVMSMDAASAANLLTAFGVEQDSAGAFRFSPLFIQTLLTDGVDLYREICCALGFATTTDDYVFACASAGSKWNPEALRLIFPKLHENPFRVCMVPGCEFLHFGSTWQLIESGQKLAGQNDTAVILNCTGRHAQAAVPNVWLEACRVRAPLQLTGGNVLVGVDVDAHIALPHGACIDVLPGLSRHGSPVWFARLYGIRDSFKDSTDKGATLCGFPLLEWLHLADLSPEDVWTEGESAKDRTLWSAKVFPATHTSSSYADWLWMFEPHLAEARSKATLRLMDRYSMAEMALLADQAAFHARRFAIWSELHPHKKSLFG